MRRYITVSFGLAAGTAFVCLLAFLPWVLGVPGVQNEYARGWNIGFKVISIYPCVWLVMALARKLWVRITKSEKKREEMLRSFAVLSNILVAVAVLCMAYAFVIMRRA
jgi:hypothetical protein